MHIVQDRRQQDGIASARWDRKSTEALWEDGGEGEEGSPMYLRIVGQKEECNSNDRGFVDPKVQSLTGQWAIDLSYKTLPQNFLRDFSENFR